MVSEIVKRILIGVIATVLFCVSLAIFAYTPVSNREPNSSYTSLPQLFTIYAIFSGPVFIIAGVIWSFVIDKISVKHQHYSRGKRYLRKFIWYVLAGIVSTLIFLFIISNGDIVYNSETFSFLSVGIIASLLYYHLLIISHFLFNQRRGLFVK
jgi:cytochrome bd-type quinol oxidase subunit 2